MSIISINDKVKIKFGIQADKKGYTGKTDFAIGTVIIKNIIAHDFTETHTSTIYLVKFDEEYFLERSDDEKKRFIFNFKSDEFITEMTYYEQCPSVCHLYLKPVSIERV
jgi:hypothetical protein